MNAIANPDVDQTADDVSSEALELPGEEGPDVHRIHEEAKYRFAQILREIQADLHPYIHYELQERMNGRDVPEEGSVIRMEELETLLYADSLPKSDIRLIIAGIRHRARKAQQACEARARERQKADRTAGTVRKTMPKSA